jgi:hypothetical protein
LLERERDWCHEQLPLALPARLAELARAAGLRSEELSFSYLTLHAGARSLADLDPARSLARMVSSPLRSKGKLEVAVCGASATRKLRRLDRHASDENRVLDAVHRGCVLRLPESSEQAASARAIDAATRVELVHEPCDKARIP